jgi:hypothetical protein
MNIRETKKDIIIEENKNKNIYSKKYYSLKDNLLIRLSDNKIIKTLS